MNGTQFIFSSDGSKAKQSILIEIDEDVDLTTMMAHFVHLTRLIGYQEGSWDNVIKSICSECDNSFRLYDWADEIIY